MSTIQAFCSDPSTEWVIKSAPRFLAIKHKMGYPICDTSVLHCMAAKQAYKIRLDEKDISKAVADVYSERSAKKKAEECRAKMTELYDKLDSQRVTIKNLGDQVQSLEKQLQEAKDNSTESSTSEELILENKHLKKELEYYIERTDIPALNGEDDNEDLTGLPTIPEEIPQNIPLYPPTRLTHPAEELLTEQKSENLYAMVFEIWTTNTQLYDSSCETQAI
ncbi:hypothetical protein M422DRAFT_272651 [Sphaerobolus stellatus SS14]|uniref:Uncharacterized protein n=1 Tax=Sphaerobolus stellatus (strain SS14) TaxID=990650 RepID=A0A0C9ULH3_SPHS4|nr:hypothetical protein M422DRAFT_272651 [Sphaerobolus stellatus SS14]